MGFYLDMINVGQGDSFLVSLESQFGPLNILVDAGTSAAGADVLRYVNTHAPEGLDLIFITHMDSDHIGGMPTVLEYAKLKQNALLAMNLPPGLERWKTQRDALKRSSFSDLSRSKRLLDAMETSDEVQRIAASRGLPIHAAVAGNYWPSQGNCGDVRLLVLNPTPNRLLAAWAEAGLFKSVSEPSDNVLLSAASHYMLSPAPDTSAENDSSIVIEIEYRGKPYGLLTSDAGAGVLKEVTAGKQYSFLKVPHHGSKTGLDAALAAQFCPTNAFIPVGDNCHGHPCIEVLDMLRDVGARTYCSTKTPDCRRECANRTGSVSLPVERPMRGGFETIDLAKCQNNFKKQAAY